jgi:hypothetical protein
MWIRASGGGLSDKQGSEGYVMGKVNVGGGKGSPHFPSPIRVRESKGWSGRGGRRGWPAGTASRGRWARPTICGMVGSGDKESPSLFPLIWISGGQE